MPRWLRVLLTASLVALVVASYLVALRLTLDASRLDADTTANDRDRLLAGIHGGVLLAAALLGSIVGRWAGRSAVGYALLLVAVVVVAMLLVQLGSFELACRGHNDLVRHWQC